MNSLTLNLDPVVNQQNEYIQKLQLERVTLKKRLADKQAKLYEAVQSLESISPGLAALILENS